MFGIKKIVKKVWAMRPAFSSLSEVVGFVALVYGVALFSVPVAFIVGGILLIVAGGISA
jgi:hypothetical protein